mmetsp:Transcript_24134/g.47415  ORF Transcript_24134/g.47415 Transcript_24134/m.47415 type:complete len:123 (+) Transcript_24134:1112-1480(+)
MADRRIYVLQKVVSDSLRRTKLRQDEGWKKEVQCCCLLTSYGGVPGPCFFVCRRIRKSTRRIEKEKNLLSQIEPAFPPATSQSTTDLATDLCAERETTHLATHAGTDAHRILFPASLSNLDE